MAHSTVPDAPAKPPPEAQAVALHDLLNDIAKEEVMADILGRIDSRLPRV